MKLWHAFWYLMSFAYRRIWRVASYCIIPTTVLIASVAIFPKNVQQRDFCTQCSTVIFFFLGMYGLFFVCTLPTMLINIARFAKVTSYCKKEGIAAVPFQKHEIRNAILENTPLSDHAWFLFSTSMRVHMYPASYIQDLSRFRKINGRGGRSDYGVKLTDQNKTAFWIYFAAPSERKAFFNWYHVYQNRKR